MSAPATNGQSRRLAIVTGATSGLGWEIARQLAQRGDAVVVVGRGDDRAKTAAAEIARITSNSHIDSVGVTDLARPSEVRELAATLLARYPAIHVLVNNAGGYFRRRDVTTDGLERTFALNVLAPFLLTSLLADRLRASAPSRVVNLSSAAHYRQRVNFDDLQSTRDYSGFDVYGASKLEILLLTREFARRWAGTGVTVNAVHPGFVASGFAQNNGGGTAFFIWLMSRIFGKSVRSGAVTPVFVASDPSLTTVTGAYFSSLRVHPGDPASRDLAAAARLFAACEQIVAPPSAAG
jgi:NAD(P)-dependent dehydrogenase (short-subunit alcohol dehydrogenase family)